MAPLRPVETGSRNRGAGGGEVLVGPETWLDRNFEQVGEVALRELGTDIGPVACLLEQVRVRVESHARARVTEDAADLNDVEADVDDQMAGECVAQIVETHPPPVAIETRGDGSPTRRQPDAAPASRRCGARTRCHARLRTRNRTRR